MEQNDIVLPNLIVRRLELEPHDCEPEPDYCRQYSVRFYNTDTDLLRLKHDQQFDQVMEVYQQYMNVQQERLTQIVDKPTLKDRICYNKCCEKQKTCTCNIECKTPPHKVVLNDLEEELEEEIAVINPTYDEPVVSIINDIINYVITACDDKQAHGDDTVVCEVDEEVCPVDPVEEEIKRTDLSKFQRWLLRVFCCSMEG